MNLQKHQILEVEFAIKARKGGINSDRRSVNATNRSNITKSFSSNKASNHMCTNSNAYATSNQSYTIESNPQTTLESGGHSRKFSPINYTNDQSEQKTTDQFNSMQTLQNQDIFRPLEQQMNNRYQEYDSETKMERESISPKQGHPKTIEEDDTSIESAPRSSPQFEESQQKRDTRHLNHM